VTPSASCFGRADDEARIFDEYTVVVRGQLRVETRSDAHDISAGQAIHVPRGQWVRYSTPGAEGAEYFSVCLPAFSPETVHRDEG
jgi:mannose-6-phosphate isomerase-like protein (cupin superfamily)